MPNLHLGIFNPGVEVPECYIVIEDSEYIDTVTWIGVYRLPLHRFGIIDYLDPQLDLAHHSNGGQK